MFNLLGGIQKKFSELLDDEPVEVCEKENSGDTEKTAGDGVNKEPKRAESDGEFNLLPWKEASLLTSKALDYAKVLSSTAQQKANDFSVIINEHTPLGNLNKENEKFKQALLEAKKEAEPREMPWSGLPEGLAKKNVLSLSLDERNFLAEAPSGAELEGLGSNLDGLAKAMIDEDPNLQKMRYELVPKKISEENFWRNYFYRVSLMRKLMLEKQRDGSLIVPEEEATSEGTGRSKSESDEVSNGETSLSQDLASTSLKNGGTGQASGSKKKKDAAVSSDGTKSPLTEEDWEKELLNELNDFEMVDKMNDKSEEEINELLSTLEDNDTEAKSD